MKKKGFTLIELLAVIVVLAIIAIIAIPLITNVIEKAKEGAFKDSVNGIVDATEKKIALDMVNGKAVANTYIFTNGEEKKNELSKYFKGDKPDKAKIKVNNDRKISFAIWNKDLEICAYQKKDSKETKYSKNIADFSKCNELAFPGSTIDRNFFSTIYWNYNSSYIDNSELLHFVDYIDTTKAVSSFDLSEAQDGSIIGWAEKVDGTAEYGDHNIYHLYIGSNGTIYAPEDVCMLFSSFGFDAPSGAQIIFDNFDTSNVTDMSNMFSDNNSLTSLDVSSFDTSNVTDMHEMFFNCPNLTNLDLSSFDTSNVTNMSEMFFECYGLVNLDVSSFNTSNVTDMSNMFCLCLHLTSLDVSHFDTSKVTNMSGMFSGCDVITSLDVSSFDTSKVTDMSRMFISDSNLATIYVGPNWVINSGTDTTDMFYGCGTNTTTLKA